jgi:hypothetical protein
MRAWTKWTGLAIGGGLVATSAIAADHADGPAVEAVDGADIADVYAFPSPSGDADLSLIQTIQGGVASDAVHYVFHIGRAEDGLAAIVAPPTAESRVICHFPDGVATDTECWLDTGGAEPADYASGDASTLLEGVNGLFRIHAGQHADPFYFHLQGFRDVREVVLGGYAGLEFADPDSPGCPTNLHEVPIATQACVDAGADNLAAVLRGMLNGTFDNVNCASVIGPVNFFATNNIFALVVEVDTASLTGSGDYLQVWASTHQKP